MIQKRIHNDKKQQDDIIHISGMQEKILRELAIYKFLTVSQMLKLR
jgi:hypothetical protein